MTRATKTRFAIAAVLAAACPVLSWVFSRWGEALFPAYRNLSKAVAAAQAAVAGVVPFALWDIAALALVAAAIVSLVRRIRRRRPLSPWFSWVCLVCMATAFLFEGWALNHYAPSLASEMGLEVGEYTVDELADATEHYLGEAASLASQVPRESGTVSGGEEPAPATDDASADDANSSAGEDSNASLSEQDFYELARIAGASYENLSSDYAIFQGSTAPVKVLLVWGYPLLYSGHTGIYWAPTGESGVPLDCAPAELPFTMCHEAAHRLGIASEQEGNFAAFLACQANDDVRFRYSGYYEAFAYCYNALYRADPDCARQVLQDFVNDEVAHDSGADQNGGGSPDSYSGESGNKGGSPDSSGVALVLQDRADTSEHYRQFEGPFEEVGTTVNDTYLKSFGETSGVRSYGQVVDYLIAWYEQGKA